MQLFLQNYFLIFDKEIMLPSDVNRLVTRAVPRPSPRFFQAHLPLLGTIRETSPMTRPEGSRRTRPIKAALTEVPVRPAH